MAQLRWRDGSAFPWSPAVVFRAIPRDRLYDLVARNRYRIFGCTEMCYAPRPEYRDRFLG